MTSFITRILTQKIFFFLVCSEFCCNGCLQNHWRLSELACISFILKLTFHLNSYQQLKKRRTPFGNFLVQPLLCSFASLGNIDPSYATCSQCTTLQFFLVVSLLISVVGCSGGKASTDPPALLGKSFTTFSFRVSVAFSRCCSQMEIMCKWPHH